jgi:hypothetical protein
MNDLPKIGAKVMIWPAPGRAVQDGPLTLDAGGRFLPKEGREVIWSYFHHEQYRSGDLFLHDPAGAQETPADDADKE